ncbi:hypothetical protein A0H81_14437 [Grifola frondosa]|uniref:HNH nuclease domain-containing protein n=1 Tax=Grifola frondosa TaxID=5627 RepID=A0A1C7LLZ9_GRIFR|nr:hypothetical protein A0H81_14437 [Grifola frondosa]
MRLPGLHLDDRQPVSNATCYRWIKLARHRTRAIETDLPFELRPPWGCLPPTIDSLIPGDFGIYVPDDRTIGFVEVTTSFVEEDEMAQEYLKRQHATTPSVITKYEMAPSIIAEVRSRDHDTCVITGTSLADSEVVVSWICPPTPVTTKPISFKLHESLIYEDLTPYLSPSNALVLRHDVAELFTRNMIGIDVDDNYRIFFFVLLDDCPNISPLSHLDVSSMDPSVRPSDIVLRKRFIRCLHMNFVGGSIKDDYREYDIDGYMDLLDEAWKKVFEYYLRQRRPLTQDQKEIIYSST